jgi:hypothetical protein
MELPEVVPMLFGIAAAPDVFPDFIAGSAAPGPTLPELEAPGAG